MGNIQITYITTNFRPECLWVTQEFQCKSWTLGQLFDFALLHAPCENVSLKNILQDCLGMIFPLIFLKFIEFTQKLGGNNINLIPTWMGTNGRSIAFKTNISCTEVRGIKVLGARMRKGNWRERVLSWSINIDTGKMGTKWVSELQILCKFTCKF